MSSGPFDVFLKNRTGNLPRTSSLNNDLWTWDHEDLVNNSHACRLLTREKEAVPKPFGKYWRWARTFFQTSNRLSFIIGLKWAILSLTDGEYFRSSGTESRPNRIVRNEIQFVFENKTNNGRRNDYSSDFYSATTSKWRGPTVFRGFRPCNYRTNRSFETTTKNVSSRSAFLAVPTMCVTDNRLYLNRRVRRTATFALRPNSV